MNEIMDKVRMSLEDAVGAGLQSASVDIEKSMMYNEELERFMKNLSPNVIWYYSYDKNGNYPRIEMEWA